MIVTLENISKVIAAGKTAFDGNVADGQIGVLKKLFCCQEPNSGKVFPKAEAGDFLEGSGKIGFFHAGHRCRNRKCNVVAIIFADEMRNFLNLCGIAGKGFSARFPIAHKTQKNILHIKLERNAVEGDIRGGFLLHFS